MAKLPEQIKKTKYEFPDYSKEELKQLEIELEDYKITKNIGDKDYTFYNEEQYLKDNGALNKFGAIIVNGYHEEYNQKFDYYYPVIDSPSLYELLKDKIEKLYKMKGKKEFAIKESLKNLSSQINIKDISSVEYYKD